MAEISSIEKALIQKFADKRRVDRYKALLKGPKHRKKFLDLLNHNFEYNHERIVELEKTISTSDQLLTFLKNKYVNTTCFLVADQNSKDGRELRLESGVEELIENYWGAILICPPKPIVIYKSEASSECTVLM